MVARELLVSLQERGVTVALENGKLTTRGPREAITPELAAGIREHKAALLARLGRHDPFALGRLPDYCGSCAHFTFDGPQDGSAGYRGTCGLGWLAHWPAETWQRHKPVFITVHSRCTARDGEEWRARPQHPA